MTISGLVFNFTDKVQQDCIEIRNRGLSGRMSFEILVASFVKSYYAWLLGYDNS